LIQVWGKLFGASIEARLSPAHVIGHDEEDIGSLGCFGRVEGKDEKKE
jgi:hypothetical protein